MPELPEVETVRRGLIPQVVGRTVTRVHIPADRVPLVRGSSPEAFCKAMTGRRFEDIGRRGKYLLFHMSGGLWWVAHLRMTGNLVLRASTEPPEPHLRGVISMDDGRDLRWSDVRKFGTWELAEDPEQVVGTLGPDALDTERFTVDHLRRVAAGRRTPVKSFLLDQSAVAGLGNIYADEALFVAGISPFKLAKDLTDEEMARLWVAIQAVLERAILHGGTSFRDFVDVAGLLGRYQDAAWVHRRAGGPCPRCGTAIEVARVGGRATYWCPRCQPLDGGR